MNFRRIIILFHLFAVTVDTFLNKADTSMTFSDRLCFTELFGLVNFFSLQLLFNFLVLLVKLSSLMSLTLFIYKLFLLLVHFIHLVGHLIFQVYNFVLHLIHFSCISHSFNF